MNTEQYEPVDRGKECTSESKNGGLVAPTVEKVEIDSYMWGEVSLMVSSSGNNLFPAKMWRTARHTQSLKIQGAVAVLKSFMAAYLIALNSKGSHAVTSRHYVKLTDFDVAFRQGSTLPLGASYKIIQTVDQSIPWSFLLAILALANFKRLEKGWKEYCGFTQREAM
ncbi:hypothetical protein FXO38_12128 [Capsicum annuum]|nr:hypothetical protein FXO38_12128 [Capsicum annuum]